MVVQLKSHQQPMKLDYMARFLHLWRRFEHICFFHHAGEKL